jgi:hypothetical protein
MSWSASFVKPIPKREAEVAIENLTTGAQTEGPAIDQCQAAKRVAIALLIALPGPYVQVSLSGHANGVGWQKKAGWANDCITISVSQICEEDLPK